MANDDTNGFYLIPQFDDILPNFEAQYFKAEFDLQELWQVTMKLGLSHMVPKSYNTDKLDIGHGR